MKNPLSLLFLLAVAAVASAADAVAPRAKSLAPGDPAPALQVREWIKGAPFTTFEKGKVYLVEFWALWCGPCIGNIPHLNALQRQYRDAGLVVVGFTSPDRTPDRPSVKEGNALEAVRDFVARRGDAMDYTIAYDLPGRETFNAYFAKGEGALPSAFIVDRDGNIAIGGHPFYLAEALADVIAGRWEPGRGKARQAELIRLIRAPDKAADYASFKVARAALAEFSPLYHARTINTELLRAIKEGDADTVHRVGETMLRQLREGGESSDPGYTINQMVRRDPIKTQAKPYLPLAGNLSEAYVAATGGRNPSALTLRAEWFACMDDWKSAVEWQRRAVAVEAESRRSHLQQRLEELEKQLTASTAR